MNPKYLYLLIDFFTILFPFLFSFYSKANFSKKWKHLWVAIAIPAIIFIVWDEAFTEWGVWGFNSRYVTGFSIGTLPIEEILFFICIPYACVFTYEAFNYLIHRDVLGKYQNLISIVLIATGLATGFLNLEKWYTATTFIGLAAYLTLLQFVWRVTYLGRFYLSYIIVLLPFFIVNGILTGSWIEEPIVWYNNEMNLGIRIGTIPVEDIFYGMLLIAMNVSIFDACEKSLNKTDSKN